jgi:hydroxymethylglutaryl-CoA reductase
MQREDLWGAVASRSSRLHGFHRLSVEERCALVTQWAGLSDDEGAVLRSGLEMRRADALVENAVGSFALPLGIATNFRVNGRDVLVPMAIEEPSVIAAASFGALLARDRGGFKAVADQPLMIGQVHLTDVPPDALDAAITRIQAERDEILALADSTSATLPGLGGGAKSVECRRVDSRGMGPLLVVHLLFDTRDAMGANAVNTACEAVAPLLESLSGGRVLMRILSNLADHRLVRSSCRVPFSSLQRNEMAGDVVADRIARANSAARSDPYRAATHNKGIMNGVDPVVIATGNDWRGAEAGAHAYAARDGTYRALTEWSVDDDEGLLVGTLELPLALGTVGGTTASLPSARVGLKVLGVSGSRELAEIAASVGLAQNLAALRALVTEGIQAGHMALHARQVALAAGASGELATLIAEQMVAEGQIRVARARELLESRDRQRRGEPATSDPGPDDRGSAPA